jgi:heme exporter protein C
LALEWAARYLRAMHAYANPLRFQRVADAVFPWVAWAALILTPAALYLALYEAPADYQQGEAYRIMYVHVPAAWMALFGYLVVAGGSAAGFIWRHPLAEVAARAAAPIGAAFTAIALFTGSVWGKPMWGTWWVWDARLTSVLILLFLYLGYMALHDAFEDPARGARAAGILALVGVVNLPIIHFSVDWWNTLHQPNSIFRVGGPTIDKSMLWPLAVTALVYHLYFVAVLLLRMRAQLTERRIQNLRLSAGG